MDKATKTKAWKELTKPFSKSVIKKSPKGFGDFVPHHIYTRRLVDSGLLKSFDTVEVIRGAEGHVISARCTLVVDSPEGEKTVTACGDVEPSAINMFKNGKKSEGELIKDAESDAIKRCCMRLGIGLHLWEQDMSEEEYSASISEDNNPKSKPKVKVEKKPVKKPTKKEQESMEKVADEMVAEKTEGKNVKQLNKVIAGFGFSKDVADTYKAQAFKKSKLSKDVESWTHDEMSKFLDLFEEASETKTNPIEEVFGEVIEKVIPTCPECGKTEYIEDNREKKDKDPEKFGAIPSWSCSTYQGKKGCGWVAWGDTDCPTEWL
tara:strand:- start:1331 stop:2290 length:960 start_codon:yes stop_codon:yes gene_type:complete